MWQTTITFLIVGIALFFVGRKIYRLIRMAIDPEQSALNGCGSSCSGCSEKNCGMKK
jgi:hypothetical protein